MENDTTENILVEMAFHSSQPTIMEEEHPRVKELFDELVRRSTIYDESRAQTEGSEVTEDECNTCQQQKETK